MDVTGVEAGLFLVLLFAPALSCVLKSIAFRNRAAGKASLMRARAASGDRKDRGHGPGKRGGCG
ncbi:hypothetical protein [Streptomyces glaucescens]|uniref:Putative membrane protein n=1 Tax=Streptomyces glaucescens TaxID=1907 RepID=A0A089X4Y9_STRGA|nr:hypothetical protein [Streptomyces glaucescens]AIR96129.1 putative membrane protein [Streptomyces glaucescens]